MSGKSNDSFADIRRFSVAIWIDFNGGSFMDSIIIARGMFHRQYSFWICYKEIWQEMALVLHVISDDRKKKNQNIQKY